MALSLTPEDIAAIAEATARRIAELLGALPANSDPWLTREQAETHLNVTRTMFFRMRKLHPDALKPSSTCPLRWSRNALDVFKLTRGAT